MLLWHAAGAFPLDVEDTWEWQDGCALGPSSPGHVPHEPMGASTDFASGVQPKAFAQPDTRAAPSSCLPLR